LWNEKGEEVCIGQERNGRKVRSEKERKRREGEKEGRGSRRERRGGARKENNEKKMRKEKRKGTDMALNQVKESGTEPGGAKQAPVPEKVTGK
jgi:hypothetical protein